MRKHTSAEKASQRRKCTKNTPRQHTYIPPGALPEECSISALTSSQNKTVGQLTPHPPLYTAQMTDDLCWLQESYPDSSTTPPPTTPHPPHPPATTTMYYVYGKYTHLLI